MSRGPTAAVGEDQGGDYAAAFRAANRMSNEGKSWSGNERNCCYLNTGGGRFADVSATTGLDFLDDGRAVAVSDWDHDGDLDLLQVNRTSPQVRFLRNDWMNDHAWIALRLVGTSCNRDAINARVRIYRKGLPGFDTRTLYAGSSFLSQSSKWLHFGLATNDKIENVEVLWPDGRVESFGALAARRRYRLVQATGTAEAVPSRADRLRLAPAQPQTPEEPLQTRIVLAARAPLPLLRYQDLAGRSVQLEFDRPTLIQLWASWCPICQAELAEFTHKADELRAAGIRVEALSVNGVGDDQSTRDEAKALIRRLRFPFAVGFANEELLAKLELLRGELFGNSLPHPIPTSFLADSRGRLVVLYLGPVDVERLIADTRQLDASDLRLRELSSPLSGRWFTPPKPILLAPLAQAYHDAGYLEDARRYRQQAAPQVALSQCALALDRERQGDLEGALSLYQTALRLAPQSERVHNLMGKHFLRRRDTTNARQSFAHALALNPNLADAHFNLATVCYLEGKLADAKASYRRAIHNDPGRADAHVALGRLLQREEKSTEAERHFRAAVKLDPKFAPAYVYLGVLYSAQNRLEQAEVSFKKAIRNQPDLSDAHAGLARVLAARGQFPQAASHYRAALRFNPNSGQAAMSLAWFIATDPGGEIGTREEAIALAQRVAQATRFRSWQSLDVLAAAYANDAQYEKATSTARQALKLAEDNGAAAAIRTRIALYENKQPYRVGL